MLRSILAERQLVDQVVVVDSASTDDTVAIAREFPVELLRLPAHGRLTAAAGRYVGFHRTDGEFVLFVDGDMELERGWLRQAIATLIADESLAGVAGMVDGPGVERQPDHTSSARRTRLSCRDVGGIALYRRSAMDRAGTFDPSLYSDEEPELCLRLARCGYQLVRLEMRAAVHHGKAERTFSALRARRRRNLFLGYGQIVRTHRSSGLVLGYLRFRGYGLAPLVVIVAAIGCSVWSASERDWRPVAALASAFVTAVSIDAVRKRSVYQALYSVLNRGFVVEGLVRGYMLARVDETALLERAEKVV